jgi:hypothetical protein
MSIFRKRPVKEYVSASVMPPVFYDEILVVDSYKNPLKGPPHMWCAHQLIWPFNNKAGTKGGVSWTEDDYKLTGVPIVGWHMEMASVSVNWMNMENKSWSGPYMQEVDAGERSWTGTAIPGFPATRTSSVRLARWGRKARRDDGRQSSCPMTLTVKIGANHYSIPDLWFQFGAGGERSVNSNWKDYELLNIDTINAPPVECYAYENGDIKKPVVVRLWVTNDGNGNPMTNIEVLRRIVTSSETVTAFQDEFNWRLAVVRFNAAVKAAKYDSDGHSDGYLGWVGLTAPLVEKFLKSEHSTGALADPVVVIGSQDVNCSVKDMYVLSLNNSDPVIDYASTWTFQNDLDVNQTLKSNDWAFQQTDTHTFTWGMSEQVAVKVTLKWESDITVSEIFVGEKFKYSFQFEAGYTHTFTQSWTDTHTDTKTITMGFQSLVVPSKSAVHLNAILSKVTASGVLGQAVQLTDDPVVKVCVLNGTSQVINNYYDAFVDLAAASRTLRMSSIVPSYTPVNGDAKGKEIVGAFTTPTLRFVAKAGAQGTMLVTPAPYVPPVAIQHTVSLMAGLN